MIPQDCALTVRNGVVCVVGPDGDVRNQPDESGVYANDTQYLRQFGVRVTDRTAPGRGWDRLERHAGPGGVTTVLMGGAPGDGRGDAREFVLKKRLSIEEDTVVLETTVRNHALENRVLDLEFEIGSSFRHVFECPGFFSPREPVDREISASASEREGTVAIIGTSPDGTSRRAKITVEGCRLEHVGSAGEGARATFMRTIGLAAGEKRTVVATATLRPTRGESVPDPEFDLSAVTSLEVPTASPASETDSSPTSLTNVPLEQVLEAAEATLKALLLPEGVPAAGAPRFVAPFGRDALLVGFQTLPFAPELTERILEYFAEQQASTTDTETRAEPGKIPHEGRLGDRPALGRSIRTPYYGTVDATPLFAALVADYAESSESSISDDLYAAAVEAAKWTISAGDENGFLWYEPHDHEYGLTHLGWKDSARAIAYPDGTAATPPIALAEVQGYAYRALRGVARLASTRDDEARSTSLEERADHLQSAFDEAFWLPGADSYALALDAGGPVEAVASNQGHALWSGIVPTGRADDVIDRLLEPDMLADAGVRTYSSSHPAFDPLSYHRGSVWPHDSSLAALGCARYGRADAVNELVDRGLGALSSGLVASPDRWGFPELLVGLDEPAVDAGHARHPDSCEPAAWSAGSAFGFAQAALIADDVISARPFERTVDAESDPDTEGDTHPEVTIDG